MAQRHLLDFVVKHLMGMYLMGMHLMGVYLMG